MNSVRENKPVQIIQNQASHSAELYIFGDIVSSQWFEDETSANSFRKELQALIDEDLGAELGCHFCHSQYQFTTQDLKDLFEKASRA